MSIYRSSCRSNFSNYYVPVRLIFGLSQVASTGFWLERAHIFGKTTRGPENKVIEELFSTNLSDFAKKTFDDCPRFETAFSRFIFLICCRPFPDGVAFKTAIVRLSLGKCAPLLRMPLYIFIEIFIVQNRIPGDKPNSCVVNEVGNQTMHK